jgi:hypothetical protein
MRARFSSRGGSGFFAFQDIITGTTGVIIVIAVFLALNLDKIPLQSTDDQPFSDAEIELADLRDQIAAMRATLLARASVQGVDGQALEIEIRNLRASISRLSADQGAIVEVEGDRELEVEEELRLEELSGRQVELADAEGRRDASSQRLSLLEEHLEKLLAIQRGTEGEADQVRLVPDRSGSDKEPLLVLVQGGDWQMYTFDGSPHRTVATADALFVALGDLPPSTHYLVFFFRPSGSSEFDSLTSRARSRGYQVGYDLIPEDFKFTLEGFEPPPLLADLVSPPVSGSPSAPGSGGGAPGGAEGNGRTSPPGGAEPPSAHRFSPWWRWWGADELKIPERPGN